MGFRYSFILVATAAPCLGWLRNHVREGEAMQIWFFTFNTITVRITLQSQTVPAITEIFLPKSEHNPVSNRINSVFGVTTETHWKKKIRTQQVKVKFTENVTRRCTAWSQRLEYGHSWFAIIIKRQCQRHARLTGNLTDIRSQTNAGLQKPGFYGKQ